MPQPSEYQEFNRLVGASRLKGSQRDEAWQIFKTKSPAEAIAYVNAIVESYTISVEAVTLLPAPVPYRVWGADNIDPESFKQMNGAMRLPVTLAGALMPDAHKGYGLPIGGVLAADNAVIPYAVGVDIACRMMISLYPVSPDWLDQPETPEYAHLSAALVENTIFGAGEGGIHKGNIEHSVLDEQHWQATDLLRSLRKTAVYQIGTSGTGNHFVEWGIAEITHLENPLGLQPGSYLALLSHSGSRGVGYKIAEHYSKLAMSLMPHLDESVKHLAWLPLDREAGQEYWDAMSLAGEFASANHHVIHERVARAAGLTPVAAIENHHNFAWRETVQVDGVDREVVVHRKGATPAGKGTLGIIPGTMADKGYLIMGKGEPASLQSASHGSGRLMSRTRAKNEVTPQAQADYLAERHVTLIGGGLDESPQAYKPIETVIAAQADLVEILGTFQPRLVRMASDAPFWKPAASDIVDAESD